MTSNIIEQDINPIPIVIIHLGNQNYFQECVKINALKNPVFVLGDYQNANTFTNTNTNTNKITHINCDTLDFPELQQFRHHFTNYSTNSAAFELICFVRIFYLKRFMEMHQIDRVFHVDSDCIVFDNVTELYKHIFGSNSIDNGIAYSKNIDLNPHHMVGCVHNAYLTVDFCNKFIQLCFDIYVNKSKYHLIEPKIQWHLKNNIGGGICDMTLYYLLFSENMLKMRDLNEIVVINGEKCTFDHNINIGYGYLGKDTFMMGKRIKMLTYKNGAPYATDNTGQQIRLLSLHFSGVAKSVLGQTFNIIKGA